MLIGAILISIGVIALLIKLGVLSGSVWGYAWPIILVILGLGFLWSSRSQRLRSWWYQRWCFPRQGEKKD